MTNYRQSHLASESEDFYHFVCMQVFFPTSVSLKDLEIRLNKMFLFKEKN